MARSLKLRHASWVFGFGGALVLGALFPFAAETTESAKKDSPAAESSKNKPSASSKSKAWKSGGDSDRRPRPSITRVRSSI